jgi:hypothetical protein
MPRQRLTKTSFTSGEIAPELYGRHDLKGYENGAARLRNVVVKATGGVTRRPGLVFVDTLPGPARLVPFAFNTEQDYLLVFGDATLRVYRDDALVATVATPWSAGQLDHLAWTQNADTLIVCHPDVPPQRITRTSHTAWTVAAFAFDLDKTSNAPLQPYFRFALSAVTLTPSASTGTISLTASAALFTADHVNAWFRLAKKHVRITAVADATHATATVIETLAGTAATDDWDEQAFSAVRGWPVTAAFHQDRLVFGGSRDLPNRIWLSRTAAIGNFNLGTGLDDEGIEFGLLADQVNAVRALHPGRHLQVFTSGAEWMIAGEPLTPAAVQARRQTRIGSPSARALPPCTIDGATLFVAADGRALHEFTYTDLDQAYASADLALLARHLVTGAVDLGFDARRRLVLLPMEDGSLAALTFHRNEQVAAWTRFDTAGAFRRVAVVGDASYLLVQREAGWSVERLDDGCNTDCCLEGTSGAPTDVWSGLAHLDGEGVRVVADGSDLGSVTVAGGAVTLPRPAAAIEIGLAFTHEIVPLPLVLDPAQGGQSAPVRLVRARFRLEATPALAVDMGRGLARVPFAAVGDAGLLDAPPVPFTGDKELRGLGWRRGPDEPLWRVAADAPLPCTILSVMTEAKGAD